MSEENTTPRYPSDENDMADVNALYESAPVSPAPPAPPQAYAQQNSPAQYPDGRPPAGQQYAGPQQQPGQYAAPPQYAPPQYAQQRYAPPQYAQQPAPPQYPQQQKPVAEEPSKQPEDVRGLLDEMEGRDEPAQGALFSDETYYSETGDGRKKPKKGKLWLVFLLVAVVCALAAGYFFWNLNTLKGELDTLSGQYSEQKAEVERLEAELKKATTITEDTMIPFSTIKTYSDEVESLTDFMSRFYPDHLVFTDEDHELVYQPIDQTLARNTYNWDFLTEDPDPKVSLKAYSDPDGITAKKGIDVSEYQGNINWAKVKADGVEYAFLRVGLRGYESGTIFADSNLSKNLKNASAAKMPLGVYFYSQAATVAEAVEEAEYVLDKIEGYDIAYPVVMDIEEENADGSRTKDLTVAERTAIAKAFCDTVAKAGYKPMIYANMRLFATKLDLTQLKEYDKWFAQYFSRPYFPYEFGIWQYTAEGEVDGIEGDVDLNLSFVDYAAQE